MATIRKIQRQSGVVFKAIIKKNGLQLKSKTFSKKTDALAWAKRIEADRESMEALGSVGAGMRFNELIDLYMGDWQGKDPNQIIRASYWQTHLGNIKLVDITPDTIRKQLKDLEAGKCLRGDGKGKTKTINRPRSPATYNRYRSVLSAVFKYAIGEGFVTFNPVSRVPAKRINNMRRRFLNDIERDNLLEACGKAEWPHLRLLVLMAMTTGMRKSELMNLRWCDVDFDRNLAYLADTKIGEPRHCPVPDFVMDQLRPLRQVGKGLLFPSEQMPDKPFEFKKHWFKALNETGIVNFRWHDLRHTAASLLAMHGATLFEIGEVLGHKCAQTTLRYSHLSVEHKSRLVDKVMTAAIRQK